MLASSLATALGVSAPDISGVVETASHRYKRFTIEKRSGGRREIYHPAKQLKAIQRWLQAHIIAGLPVHPAAAAYRPGQGIVDHAKRHIPSRYLLRLDFEAFFESITADDVTTFIQASIDLFPSGWQATDTLEFTKLVCREGRLTVGAVTSPGMSNAVCFDLDAAFSAFAAANAITYSRYADDLFFSASAPKVLAGVTPFVRSSLETLPFPSRLRLNESKTRHSSMKRRRQITGLVLTNEGGVSLGRDFKRSVRSQVYRSDEITDLVERNRLAGLLAYVKDVEPEFYNRLVMRYGVRVSQLTRPTPVT